MTSHDQRFMAITEPLLDEPLIARSTMMGLPCLRVDGAFFASYDRRTGDLLVKLPAARVDELIAAGRARLRSRWAPFPRVGRHPSRSTSRLETTPG